ncbi:MULTISPECIES: tail fiber assembly protein [Photorhabdus]|uniref:tail fiber assembly protein n=1 Tax=Photorhabdus TaxID=29487 RepID=UPI000DCEB512|nr:MULTISPECIES: tail fiber assembly protein [Photorhabdus]MCT8345394.1 tail fiber assembly protein [Photorhabdus kleinii]RAW96063.1 phage tail protein [Photorhabdus sp. S9-53]RAW96130.1 phage tail protein [Photorhabdus sp. S10-54]RAX00190.1 phage tail protein [Photorhabdus sp. S8-52]
MTEQKYSLEPETAILGKDGLAEKAGWLTIYHAAPHSGEFIGTTPEYLMKGIGIPASSYIDAPTLPESDSMAVRRTVNGDHWEVVPDYRGKTAYNIQTRLPQGITELGELPETLTFKQPATHFDRWDGSKWVTDKAAIKDSEIEQAELLRGILCTQANETITLLQYAIDAELASEEEQALLLEWKKYLVLLSRVDTSIAPDIKWPEIPE